MPSEAQIQHILAVASDLVVQYTFNKTTMDDIARQAGLSKSSLYLIWKNKSQLLDALLAYEMKRLLQDFSVRLAGDPAGGELAHVVKHALLALQHNPFMRALYTRDAETLGHFVRHQNVQRYTEQWGLSVALVQTMQELQLIDDTLPPALIRHVLTLIEVGFMHIQTIDQSSVL